jgi:hypothetical protein
VGSNGTAEALVSIAFFNLACALDRSVSGLQKRQIANPEVRSWQKCHQSADHVRKADQAGQPGTLALAIQ